MSLILIVIGVFSGIAIFMATLYSLAQIVLLEGRGRAAHTSVMLATLLVMGALQVGEVGAARLLALPMLATAIWAFAVERRFYRIFPILQQVFATIVLLGYVAL